MLLLVETLNGDASFLTLGWPSPSSLSLESAFKHSPRSSVRLAPAPQVEGSSNPQADSHSQSEMTSSCLGTLGAMQGLNKSEAAKGFVISVESSRFLGSRVLWVPGFNFCHLSSVIYYLLSVIFSVQCHLKCHRLTKKLTSVEIFQKVRLHVASARSEVFVGNPSGHLSSFASRASRFSNRHPVLVVSEEACHRLHWNRREQK